MIIEQAFEGELLILFESMEDDTEIIEGLGTKGVYRATEVVRCPTTTVLRSCPLLLPESKMYEGVLGQMTWPKRARMWLSTKKRYPLRLEGGEEDGSKENQRAAVCEEWIYF